MRPPAASHALRSQYRCVLYRAWRRIGLSAIRGANGAITLILIGSSVGGCSLSRNENAFARMATGSIAAAKEHTVAPTESDLAFARNAVSDVLTRGEKDASQPWENPETGARGSVTPLAQAYSAEDGRTCRDFLASYVNGPTESWLQGSACQSGHGRWEIHTLKPWRQG